MRNISNLQNQKQKLIADAQALVTRGLSTPEAKESYRKMLADIDVLQGDIDSLSTIERRLPNSALAAIAVPVATTDASEQRRAKVNTAYRDFFRNGHRPHSPEQRDLITSVDADGAALIPQGFEPAFTQAQRFYGPIGSLVSRKDSDRGNPQKFTITDDTEATMTYLAEGGSTAGVEEDASVQSQISGTDSLVTMAKYSFQELEDAFDLESFLRRIAGVRVARAVEYALTLGKDNGTETALPNSPAGGLLGNVTEGAVTSSLAAGIPYASLVALAGSVDHAYYVNGGFMASPSVFNYLLTQTDTTGRPLYAIDPVTGLMIIAGKPLYVNNAMPAYNVASQPVVTFGDYSSAYKYLNGGGIKFRVLVERFADTLEGAAVIYHRLGAATLVDGAVKSLVTAAS